jgi:formylglycine-generating enzyme required for sulfatase activity
LTFAGSIPYMAPEMFKGVRSFRTDIWAVGVILYQMLAGRLPFEAPDLPSLMDAIRQREPLPLSGVPQEIADAVAQALLKDGNLRFQAAAEMSAALRGLKFSPPPPPPLSGFIRLPAGETMIGAKVEIVNRLVATHDLSGKRLEQLMQPPLTRKMLPSFDLARYAVSNDEYREFVDQTKYREPKHWAQATGGRLPPGLGRLPVVNVTFADAETFCQWKGVRLPSNDEWERAARGTDERAYPWGDVWRPTANGFLAHTLERHRATQEELLSVTALAEGQSPSGACQMAGNVWEWVDGGAEGKKHTRGGSWRYNGEIYALTWFRLPANPAITDDDVGFRYVRDDPANIPTLHSGTESNSTLTGPELTSLASVPAASYRLGAAPEELAVLALKMGLSPEQVQKLTQQPSREARLTHFQIRCYLVTNEEYFEFVRQTGHRWPAHWSRQLQDWSARPFLRKYQYHPVTQISYRDAAAFCQWRGGRLPTAEEWEAAARGPEAFRYPWGNEFDPSRCNLSELGLARTTAVNEFPHGQGPYGCYDLAGNVSEWTAPDLYGRFLVRGGSFEDSGPRYGLTFYGIEASPDYKGPEVGFRYVF